MNNKSSIFIFDISKTIKTIRSSRPEVFCKKAVPKKLAKFTEKNLCRSRFFNKILQKNFVEIGTFYTTFMVYRRNFWNWIEIFFPKNHRIAFKLYYCYFSLSKFSKLYVSESIIYKCNVCYGRVLVKFKMTGE